MQSCLPAVAGAIGPEGTPAGTVAVRAAGLRSGGGTVVTAGDRALRTGELAVFCRPVVTAPAVVRRDGTVLADAWLPDLARLGELERHLGDGVIEAIVEAELGKGRLKRRQRRRLMSYPLVIRLMIATGLMPEASYCEALARVAGLLADVPFNSPGSQSAPRPLGNRVACHVEQGGLPHVEAVDAADLPIPRAPIHPQPRRVEQPPHQG